MTKAKPTPKPGYRSKLREEQVARTREKIEQAAASLIRATRNPEAITYKAVAQRAGVTEMTVYRHFPTREDLLRGLWRALASKMWAVIGVPASIDELLTQHTDRFSSFDKLAPQVLASITTPEGREMGLGLNKLRRSVFQAIVDQAATGAPVEARRHAAAILQLLDSSHAWMFLREQWSMDGREAAAATRWVMDILLQQLLKKT